MSVAIKMSKKNKEDNHILTDEEFCKYDNYIKKYARFWILTNCPMFNYTGNIKEQSFNISGMTYDDLFQELRVSTWIALLEYDPFHPNNNGAQVSTFVINCIKNKGQAIAREMFAEKRGIKENHIDGDDIANLFTSHQNFDEE